LWFVQWISEGRPVTVYGDDSQSRDFTYACGEQKLALSLSKGRTMDDIARGMIAGLKPLGYEVINPSTALRAGSFDCAQDRSRLQPTGGTDGRDSAGGGVGGEEGDIGLSAASSGRRAGDLGGHQQVETIAGVAAASRLPGWCCGAGGVVSAESRLDQGDSDSMRALVTGGAGFIGANVVRRLLELGHEPIVLDNLSSGFRENLFPGVCFVEGDVRDNAAVQQAMAGCEMVFHLAASVGNIRSIEHPIADSEVNVLGTLNVLEAARAHGIRRVVFSSSAGIFGELKMLPIAEDHPQDPDSPYGVSKLAAEKQCLVYNKLYGMKNVCLRYFNVYGPRQRYDAYGNVIPIFANRILKGEPLTIYGDGEQTRDFVNVADVAAANVQAALSAEGHGVFNIGSGARITINALARMIQDAAGQEVGVQYAPPRKGDVRDSLADIRAAQKAFGFAPRVGMATGLSEYMAWIRQDPVTARQLEGN
jgi:UDP-glucose 4-epimerase